MDTVSAILSLYIRNYLRFSENASTIIYHVFNMSCYIIPLFGAICADSYYGSYKTIRNFAFIYLFGNILLCIAAVPVLIDFPFTLSVIGLICIAIGSGGIKPCVAAFGGEQFHLPEQCDQLRHFFSIFYFTINLGSFVGMMVTPILRKSISCFGEDCYVIGFAFPAALMLLSICVFVMGKSHYQIKLPKFNVIVEFIKCASYVLTKKTKTEQVHWLDHAQDKFNGKLIKDMKLVCSILVLYVPLPVFWSLFDQQGSRWTFQASHMDGIVLNTHIVADQMQVLNPIVVLLLIPLFDRVFYPCFNKFHLLENSLHRMAIGGLLAGFAFLSAGILELFLEHNYPKIGKRNSAVYVINMLQCDLRITDANLRPGEMFQFGEFGNRSYITAEGGLKCGVLKNSLQIDLNMSQFQDTTVLVGVNEQDEVDYVTDVNSFGKSLTGSPRLRVGYLRRSGKLRNVTVSLKGSFLEDVFYPGESEGLAISPFMELPQGIYDCAIGSSEVAHLQEKSFHLAFGGVYFLFIKLFTMSPPNDINILWLIPQYFLISIAEIMFGIAGLEFSFTQAPKCMKTVTIAGWYLSVAVGNLLVIIVTQLNLFDSQAIEFFFFALVMVTDMMVFIEMTSKYRFVSCEANSSSATVFHEEINRISENQ